MQIPIDTAPLRALDVPTRWLLSQAFDDARALAGLEINQPGIFDYPTPIDEAERKYEVYRQIAEALRD